MMASRGYMNNVAALEVLERLWAVDLKAKGPVSQILG